MPNVTTPAEAHDSAQDKMVRIPEQFPDATVAVSSVMLTDSILIAGVNESLNVSDVEIPSDVHLLSCTGLLSDSKTFDVQESNFNPSTGNFVFKFKTSASMSANSTIGFSLPGMMSGITVPLDPNTDNTLMMTLYEHPIGANEVLLLSHVSQTLQSSSDF